jgi:enterochelin esterase-like enzyme
MEFFMTWPIRPLAAMALMLSGMAASQASEWVADALPSAALGGELKFTVYLPDGYREAPNTRYPVVYLLHGAGGDERSWATAEGAIATLDGLIRRGLIRPTVVVMPTAGPDSWWVDGAAAKAGSALMNELLPYVDGKYRTVPERGGRAVAGLSMGGYGALNLALRHPSRFCAAGLISAAVYDPQPPETSAARRSAQFMRGGQFDPLLWAAANHPVLLEAYRRAPQKVPMWIVSGDHDVFGIALESARLHSQLLKIQPSQAELRIVDGDHEVMTFRDALPDTLQYLDRQCAKAASGAAP